MDGYREGEARESNEPCWWLLLPCIWGPLWVLQMLSHSILIRWGSWNSKNIQFSKDCIAKKYGKMDSSSDLPHSEAYVLFGSLNCIRMFFRMQTDRSKSEEVWINTSFRMTELPSWKQRLGWSSENNFFFLGRISKWDSTCLTSISQTWIIFWLQKYSMLIVEN